MRIIKIEVVAKTRPPSQNPKRDAIQALPGTGSVQVIVTTETGVEGTSEIWYGRIAGGPAALAATIEHILKPLILQQDLTLIRGLHQAMLQESEYHGAFGLTMFGIAAIDIALWDALGKTLGVPCWQLWGRVHERLTLSSLIFAEPVAQPPCCNRLACPCLSHPLCIAWRRTSTTQYYGLLAQCPLPGNQQRYLRFAAQIGGWLGAGSYRRRLWVVIYRFIFEGMTPMHSIGHDKMTVFSSLHLVILSSCHGWKNKSA